MTAVCPDCRRSNAPHRTTCLYCGAMMPNPTAPPPPQEKELPPHLDQLVREALRGGGVARLKAALSVNQRAAEPVSTPSDMAQAGGADQWAPTRSAAQWAPKTPAPVHMNDVPADEYDAIQLEVGDILEPGAEILSGSESKPCQWHVPLEEEPAVALVRLEERCRFALSRFRVGDAAGALEALEAAGYALESAKVGLIRRPSNRR